MIDKFKQHFFFILFPLVIGINLSSMLIADVIMATLVQAALITLTICVIVVRIMLYKRDKEIDERFKKVLHD